MEINRDKIYRSFDKYLPAIILGGALSVFVCNQTLNDLCMRMNESSTCTFEEKGEIADMLSASLSTQVYSYDSPSLTACVILSEQEGIEINSITDTLRIFGFHCDSAGYCSFIQVYTPESCVCLKDFVPSPCNLDKNLLVVNPESIQKSLAEAYTLATEKGEQYSRKRVILETLEDIYFP